MTSKERVQRALHHEIPDRVPINYMANPGIDQRLKVHFGLAADDTEGLLQALGVDFRFVEVPYIGPRLHPDLPDRQVDSAWGIRTRWAEHESGGYWDYCDFPLEEATLDDVERWPMPSPDDFDYAGVPEQCARFEEYALLLGHPGYADILNGIGMLRGVEQTLVDLATGDETFLRLVDRRKAIQLQVLSRALEAANGAIDVLWIGEDLGTQHAPLISPESYRTYLRPRHQQFVDLAKGWQIPTMVHSCGSSSWVYDDFIDMGIAVVDTLQPEAANMSPAYLKERYGMQLAFHGCISTAGPVAYGTVEDVIGDVREKLAVLMPGGGYAFAPTHALQDNSPTENVLAMYAAAREFGRYH